jgi:tetraacyldisaccharide-1-P 4'-kinase
MPIYTNCILTVKKSLSTALGFVYYWCSQCIKKNRSILPACELPALVVGSLRAGGGYRTSTAIALANALQQKNYRVALICFEIRSIKRVLNTSFKKPNCIALHHLPACALNTVRVTDESLLCYREFAHVYLCHNRYQAWQQISASRQYDIIVFDGGLEDRNLANATTILLQNQLPSGYAQLLPFGPYRSFLHNHPHINHKWQFLQDFFHENLSVHNYLGQSPAAYNLQNSLPSRAICVCTGIGNPHEFLTTLSQDWHIQKAYVRPNHDKNFADFLQQLVATPQQPSHGKQQKYSTGTTPATLPIVITAKDQVRLPPQLWQHPQIFCASRTTMIQAACVNALL